MDAVFLVTPITKDMIAIGKTWIDRIAPHANLRVVRLSATERLQGRGVFVGDAHRELDDYLFARRPDAIALRPTGFMQNILNLGTMVATHGILPQPIAIDSKDACIDAGDIAAVAVALLREDRSETAFAVRENCVELTGPEPVSPSDVATLFSEILAKPISPLNVSDEDAKNGMRSTGIDEWLIDRILEMRPVQESGILAATSQAVFEFTGSHPTTLREFLQRNRHRFD